MAVIEQPKVSVIIPVYNVEKYLDECVSSVLSQTYSNLEVILVDDGSPDSCPLKCDQYKEQDDRVRVIHKQNGGLSSARNAGLDIATGDYVLFVDSDDYIIENTIKNLLDLISSNNASIACFTFERFIGTPKKNQPKEGEVTTLSSSELLRGVLSQKYNCSSCTKFYRRDIIGDLRFLEGRNNEDVLFLFYLLNKPFKVVYSDNVFYYYRINPVSISSNGRDLRAILMNNEEMMRVNNESNLGLNDILLERNCYFQIFAAYTIWRKKWQGEMNDIYKSSCLYVRSHFFPIIFKSHLGLRTKINAVVVYLIGLR